MFSPNSWSSIASADSFLRGLRGERMPLIRHNNQEFTVNEQDYLLITKQYFRDCIFHSHLMPYLQSLQLRLSKNCKEIDKRGDYQLKINSLLSEIEKLPKEEQLNYKIIPDNHEKYRKLYFVC